ncbi:hypothetical protein SAMN04487894_107212 [Niabella drilacis]|uniref:Uncharacterized protein n=1 Tax=Niabella drilacis (strain DSM 25811 / CCM 8410 / CCUG 62505 / LMG 26954 / E90) TaxID=1285928 RepID=A0A1G6TIT3_NIADE|nr:hypothetical protein SAMN04487894_107212 [Niabella drilacis]
MIRCLRREAGSSPAVLTNLLELPFRGNEGEKIFESMETIAQFSHIML